MNFIFDPSLVLYLPLYQRYGSSFMSRDAYGHLATATGALWTPQGRTFDGVDDNILVPYQFNPGAADFSIVVWLYPARVSSPVDTIFTSDKSNSHGVGNYGIDFIYVLDTGTGKGQIQGYYSDGSSNWGCMADINLNNWHYVVLLRSGSLLRLYVDTVAGHTDGNVGISSMTWDANFTTKIGSRYAGDLTPFYRPLSMRVFP